MDEDRRKLLLEDARKLEDAYEVLGRRSNIGQASTVGQTIFALAEMLRRTAATARTEA